MDPVSIAAAAGEVAKLALGCTTSLYSFIKQNKNIDDTVQGLYNEVESLKLTARSVESTLERPDLVAFKDLQLWADAEFKQRNRFT